MQGKCTYKYYNICSRDDKELWIRAKYEQKEFMPPPPYLDVPLPQVSGLFIHWSLYPLVFLSSGLSSQWSPYLVVPLSSGLSDYYNNFAAPLFFAATAL